MANKPSAPAKVAAEQKTQVGVAAEFEVGTIIIPISAADLTHIKENGLQFALPPGEVVEIASIKTFFEKLASLLGVPSLALPTKQQLQGTPFASLLDKSLQITRLSLNTKSGDFSIAIGFKLEHPEPLMKDGPLKNLKLRSLAFSVDSTGD